MQIQGCRRVCLSEGAGDELKAPSGYGSEGSEVETLTIFINAYSV